MEYVKLSNGVEMPMAGLGTFMLKPSEAESAVLSALTEGVRLIDTANAYMNEKAIARAVQKSGAARSEIFLVSKLWPTVYENENAVDDTLQRLGTDYLDLLFLHQPAGNWRAGYKNLERAYKEGKIKAIGLSNFPYDKLNEIIETADIKPHVVQVEAHPYYPETELKQVLKDNHMALMAWFPLGHGDRKLIRENIFLELGEKYGKSPAQIILRWHIQSGNIIIPGSKNPEHIRDNFNIFDFQLTEDEMAEIKKLDQNKRYYSATPEQLEKYASMTLNFNNQI